MNWKKIEEIINEPLPICVKKILTVCAYDTLASPKSVSIDSCVEIENHINLNSRQTIQELNCCHSDHYKKQSHFKLLPGHRDLIISLSKISLLSQENSGKSEFSRMLKEFIHTAIENGERDCPRYSDTIKWFATYVFLLCGRSCYEVLNHNLPLPSTKTIRKYLPNNFMKF